MIFFKTHSRPRVLLKTLLKGGMPVSIQFDRLNPGIDNIRYDVHLSPAFRSVAAKLIFKEIVSTARAQDRVDTGSPSERADLRNSFKRACQDVLLAGIRLAKDFKENQIDLLAQVALYKFLMREIRERFDALCGHFKESIRETERPHAFNAGENIRLKQALSDIFKNRQAILYTVSKKVFQRVQEVQQDPVGKYRESVFGADARLPEDLFNNPLLFVDASPDDTFMISDYLLFGHRYEDANRYEALIDLVKQLLMSCNQDAGENGAHLLQDPESLLDEWIADPKNIHRLFNTQASLDRPAPPEGPGHSGDEHSHWKQRALIQKHLLHFFYRRFQKLGLISIVCASYEIQQGFSEYCPPLTPQAVLQFVVNPKSRDATLDRLKRLSRAENRIYSTKGLHKMIRQVRRLRRRQKEAYLLQYLQDLSRYHRDLKNAVRIREAMEAVHLITEDKTLNLSRENNLLHAFLLPEEETGELRPVINHVVLKADVRGSTEIVRQMKHKGLNPASFFSLNFFDPINQLLETYEAEKVFIEGDAIILTLLERAQAAKHLFTVARACGLAMDILSVVQRCNSRSKKAGLPVIEIGIGISFQAGPPTYLFDGERRIMISPAINEAHSLCRCDKQVVYDGEKKPQYNLIVFETKATHQNPGQATDPFMIYNVNGIALDAGGFRKLSHEIDLQVLDSKIPEFAPHRLRLHVGRFLNPLGIKRTLVVREAPFSTQGRRHGVAMPDLDRVYYEICTYPPVLAWAEKILA